jgi:hypothetical protein
MGDEDRSSNVKVVGEGDARRHGRRLRAKTMVVGIVAVLGALMVVEQVGAAPSTGRRTVSHWSSFQPTVTPRPPSNTSGTSDSGVPTGQAALAAAQQQADAAVAKVQNAAANRLPGGAGTTGGGGSGVAAQRPNLGARICPILLEEGAELIAQTNRLIAKNPSLAPQLIAVRDRGLARINQLLARFGCPISFG